MTLLFLLEQSYLVKRSQKSYDCTKCIKSASRKQHLIFPSDESVFPRYHLNDSCSLWALPHVPPVVALKGTTRHFLTAEQLTPTPFLHTDENWEKLVNRCPEVSGCRIFKRWLITHRFNVGSPKLRHKNNQNVNAWLKITLFFFLASSSHPC